MVKKRSLSPLASGLNNNRMTIFLITQWRACKNLYHNKAIKINSKTDLMQREKKKE